MIHRERTRSVLCLVALGVCTLPLVGVALAAAKEKQAIDPFVQNQKLGGGVNIIGYDPLWRSRDQARFKVGYFQMLKDAGFSNVRINLHPFRRMEASNDFALPASWWETLDWAVTNAGQSGLMVILDLHEFGAMGTDPETNKPKFLAFWRQVSERLRDAPDSVLFEILNEPSRKLTAEMWNQYLGEALAIIRKTNPVRTVIIGPAGYNSIGQLSELKLPEGDRNIIVTVHYYSPMDFTHQGASWAGRKDKLNVEWKGTDQEKAAVERDFAKAQTWAKEHNRPIFLGEFGVYDKAPMESRVRYLAFLVGTMEKLGWSWAYWQFDSDFVLYDVKNDKWVEPVRDALTRHANPQAK
jgi:endoglucanase